MPTRNGPVGRAARDGFRLRCRCVLGRLFEVGGVRELGARGSVVFGTEPGAAACEPPIEPVTSNLESIVKPEVHERSYGNMPVRPDGKSCVPGVNSFARLPVLAGEFSAAVAQHIGYRIPRPAGLDTASNSGLWIAAVDRKSVDRICGDTTRRAFYG